MQKLYIAVLAFFIIAILLFVAAFIYLEKEKHGVYYYTVNLEGHDIGIIKVETYVTEDKLIYKSSAEMPFAPLFTRIRSKITFDRKYNLSTFFKEASTAKTTETLYLETTDSTVSSIAVFDSEFAYADNIPIRKKTFVFEEDNPITYLPLIENYDFRKGRFQGFNAITVFTKFLPPMKRFVTLTSIRDEYLDIGGRAMKTEHLLLKTRNYPQGDLWVSKKDRSLVMIELPQKKLKLIRTESPVKPQPKEYAETDEAILSRPAIFKSKNIQLAGTFSCPKGNGKYPAILLIWGAGPQDRRYQGLFYSLSNALSKKGFCVLRFDKRGVGESGGDFGSTTNQDILDDLKAALEYLASQKEVDAQQMVLIGHMNGSFYASVLASEFKSIKAIILMAPIAYLRTDIDNTFESLKIMAVRLKWTDEYLKLAMRSIFTTIEKIKETSKDWISILGKRCFLAKIRGELTEKPGDYVKKLKVPVLILEGKEDDMDPMQAAVILDKAMEEAGHTAHTLTYFGYLDRFFGKKVNNRTQRIHYEVDGEVPEAINSWLIKNLTGVSGNGPSMDLQSK